LLYASFFIFNISQKKHCLERCYLIQYKRKERRGKEGRGRERKKGKESSIFEFHSWEIYKA